MTAPAPMIILPPWTIFLYYEFQKDFHPKAQGQFVQTKVLKVMKGSLMPFSSLFFHAKDSYKKWKD